MIASPYAFLRGTAAIMADDFAALPATGITPVICGDAHLGNFGFYASPERDLVFDLNDFDEAHPGAWEWDLRRLVDQRVGRRAAERLPGASACEDAVRAASPPTASRSPTWPSSRCWPARSSGSTSTGCRGGHPGPAPGDRAGRRRARRRTSDRALPRFTEQRDGTRRIVEEPPLITRLDRARPSCSPRPSTPTC